MRFDQIAARLSKFYFVKTFVFDQPNMQPEHLSRDDLPEIIDSLPGALMADAFGQITLL